MGLTTLRDHMCSSTARATFAFACKGGKRRRLRLDDPRAARALRHCHELPGHQLLQYVADDGELVALTSTDVNDALQQLTGESFTAKTFRTWGASSDAFERLVAAGPAESQAETLRNLNEALRETAGRLGNTLAVCRKYYVHPAIGDAYLEGALPASLGKARKSFSEAESALARSSRRLVGAPHGRDRRRDLLERLIGAIAAKSVRIRYADRRAGKMES